ncbi:hypothetical protein [Rhodopirellula bahusiensis]|uniref:hypothetical protein n=2 Tax=Rhodopirellula bahusiensis TaxID=2014065 RepID=UPI003267F1AB
MAGRGLRYTLGILWCRIVPAWCLRYRCMEIVRLGAPANAHGLAHRTEAGAYLARKVDSRDEIEAVERVTLYQRSPPQRASEPSNNNISSEPSFQAYGLFLDESREPNLSSSDQVHPEKVLVGGVWLAAKRFDESDLHLQIELSEHQRWLFAARLLPDVRGRGAYSTLLHEVLSSSVLPDPKKAVAVWAAINPANHRSMRAHVRFQIANAGRIHVLRIGPFAISWRGRTSIRPKMTMNPKWTFRGSESPIRLRIGTDQSADRA